MKHEYRVIYQRKGKVQRVQRYAIKSRAERRCEQLTQDPTLSYARMQQREIGAWSNTPEAGSGDSNVTVESSLQHD